MKTIVCLAVSFGFAQAADFWNEKKPEQWTKKEAQRLLSRSPWAKDGPVQWNSRESDDTAGVRSPGVRTPVPRTSPDDPSTLPRPSETAETPGWNVDGQEMVKTPFLLIRWESAAAIREAESRLEMEMPDRAAESYMVSVSGFPRSQPLPAPDSREALKKLAKLKIKGKDPIFPGDVDVLKGDKGFLLIFFFPRKPAIESSDGQVTFELDNGNLHIEAVFPLKDMRFQGELAL